MKSNRNTSRQERSCWSTFVNFFPKALVTYLALYSAVASAVPTNTLYRNTYLRARNGLTPVDADLLKGEDCVNAAPHCYLAVRSNTETQPISVNQICNPEFVPTPVDEQLVEGRVFGQSLCGNTLRSVSGDPVRGQITMDEFDVGHRSIQHTHRLFFTPKQEKPKAEECIQKEIGLWTNGELRSTGDAVAHRCEYTGQAVTCVQRPPVRR